MYRCRLSCRVFSSIILVETDESQASGYLPQYIRIPLLCKHRRGMTFYDLAYSISAGYRDIFRVSEPRSQQVIGRLIPPERSREGFAWSDSANDARRDECE